ncbi:alpha/beta hydrolase [Tsukamurella sp. NPDC003166]|uniref:alpha/beta hydrolase n=1 Tax=Tsukamurella sp. NPDC003166 TaxID=3154444 RepID=UPI0033BABADD
METGVWRGEPATAYARWAALEERAARELASALERASAEIRSGGGELAARLAAIELPAAVVAGAPSSPVRLPTRPRTAAQRDLENRARLAVDLGGSGPHRKIAAIIAGRLAELARGGETVQLIEYDPAAFGGDGAVVVAIGDLDAARNIGVVVPGMGTTAASIGSVTLDAARLQVAARRADPTTATATVAWIGYDAPSGPAAAGQVLTGVHARRGAAELRADLADLRRMRPDRPRVVVFGHSYGSTTVATAAADGALAGTVDALVLLGSPGAGPVRSAAETGVPVYVARDRDDPVPAAGGFDGAGRALRRLWGVELGLGADPSAPSFGATALPAGGPAGFGVAAHSGYFDEESSSLGAFAEVLVGARSAAR